MNEVEVCVEREREEVAELLRDKGCICQHLNSSPNWDGMIVLWDGRDGHLPEHMIGPLEVRVHDSRCPIAIADEVEKRGFR